MASSVSLGVQDLPDPQSSNTIREERVNATSILSGASNFHVETLNIKPTADRGELGTSSLNPILDASHKRDLKVSPPNSSCLPGTRKSVIEEIVAWAMRSFLRDPQHILWIFGYAGCGKSAIAQAVAKALEAADQLGASFFFFRGAGDRSRIGRLAQTIASQIAVTITGTAQHIQAALDAIPGLLGPVTPLAVQFHHLVYDPIRAVAGKWSGVWNPFVKPFVILIDGFDECEDKEEVSQMIQDLIELFDQRPDMPLRFIITSRVEDHLHKQLHESKQVRLFNLVYRTSHKDISKALDASIRDAQKGRVLAACKEGWLSRKDKQTLIKHVAGSFIFLTTITNFLFAPFEHDQLTPLERLPLALNMNPGFDGLYKTILESCQQSPHFSDILSVIALAYRSLSTVEIADLLEIKVVAVVSLLVKLHAIIHLPDDDAAPITLWHTSLRDFLNDESRPGHLSATRYKVQLAPICIDLATPPISTKNRPASLYARRYVREHCHTVSRAFNGGREDIYDPIPSHLRRKDAFLDPSEVANELYRSVLASRHISPRNLDILKTLCMAMEPLSITQVTDLLDINKADVKSLIENVGGLIQSPRDSDTPIAIPSSLHAFLCDKSLSGALFASPEHHVYLTRRCAELAAAPSSRPALRYAERHLLSHYDLTLNVIGRQDLRRTILDLLQSRKETLAAALDDVVTRLYQSILYESKATPHSLRIMRTVALAESPLSAAQIAHRLNIRTDQVINALSGLRDIVNYSENVGDFVEFHHAFLRDFLAKEDAFRVQSTSSPSNSPRDRWAGPQDTDIIIPVIGDTGAGKSYFINRVLRSMGQQDAVLESDALVPWTTEIMPVVIEGRMENYEHIRTRRVVLVDCPGFDADLDRKADFELLKRLVGWLEDSHRYGTVLGGVIYLQDVSTDGLRGNPLKRFDRFNQYYEDKLSFSSVVLVTSKWGYDSEKRCSQRESMLKEFHWRDVLKPANGQKGARVMRLKPGRAEEESAWEIVASILEDVEKVVADCEW